MRFSFALMAMIGGTSAGWAADAASSGSGPASLPPVPGARVTMEGGVRVIRPVAPPSGANALEQAGSHGSLIYRGAAFYRVPSASPSTAVSDGSKTPLKVPGQ